MINDKPRAWLITPFAPAKPCMAYPTNPETDIIIAVDGGLERCNEFGLRPQVLIGDLDSIESYGDVNIPHDCVIITYPVNKDETDTELAIQYCIEQGYSDIIIINDLGGRFDHVLGLLQNLQFAKLAKLHAKIVTDKQMVFFLEPNTELNYQPKTKLSLVPWSDKAVFKKSSGLQWKLDNMTLLHHKSRGISNEITSSPATITLKSGDVIAMVTIL